MAIPSCSSSWSNIPLDILFKIFSLLEDPSDIFRCRHVCFLWRIVASEVIARQGIPKLLIIFNKYIGEDCVYLRSLSNLEETRRIYVPEICNTMRRVCNSTNGWLLTLDFYQWEDVIRLYLLNPISRIEIPLPKLSVGSYSQVMSIQPNLLEVFIRKGITSTRPLDRIDCIVLIIYGGGVEPRLAFCRLGDNEWKDLEYSLGVPFVDIVYCKGRFYATDEHGRILICELNGSNPKVEEVSPAIKGGILIKYSYLVESLSGDILLVLRNLGLKEDGEDEEFYDLYEVSFEVFKIEVATKERKKLGMLGDQALFIGRDGSTLVPLVESSAGSLRGNCIYFIENVFEGHPCGCYGMNMFDMETKSVNRLYELDIWSSRLHWILPKL